MFTQKDLPNLGQTLILLYNVILTLLSFRIFIIHFVETLQEFQMDNNIGMIQVLM